MNINWEKLKGFYQVASAGSITRAADQNNKTLAAMSSLIRTFENELQVKLFFRNGTGLTLTREGERLYATASHIFNLMKAEEESLEKELFSDSGHIKTLASAGVLSRYIESFIDDFLFDHPDISLEFLASNDLSIQEKLNGDILIHPYMDDLKGYKQEHLVDLDLKLYASREYLDKFGEPKEVKDLDNHRLIASARNKQYPANLNWHLLIGRNPSDMREPFLEIDEIFGNRCRVCSKGVGIISVPKQHPELKIYDLVEILPHIKGPTTTYYLIVNEMLYKYSKIRKFTSFLKEKFSQL